MSTPIENLRKHHKPCEPCIYTNHWFARTAGTHCQECLDTWPCDTVAALDALEVEGRDIQFRMFELQTRLGAATGLIRQAMRDRHYSIRPYPDNEDNKVSRCGSPLGTSIDTCPDCAPYREWLAGKEGEGQ